MRVWPLLILCSCACERVLGIEEASIDPGLEGGGEPCAEYCDTVMQNCQGAEAVYSSRELCFELCASMPPGAPGATSGHSVACRRHVAELAPLEPLFYCPSAGPGGHGICGDNCESFCQLVPLVCGGQGFADEADCWSECTGLADLGAFTIDASGNHARGPHVQCRLYHLTVATLEPDRHCPHAFGGPPCN